jgi:hypothetical protein
MEKDGWLYLIGHGYPKIKNRLGAHVGRVRPASIMKRNEYDFLTGAGSWTKKSSEAHSFFNEVSGELSLSYNTYLKKYIIIYCSIQGDIRLVQFTDFGELAHAKPAVIYTPPKLPLIRNRPFLFYYSGKEIFSTNEALYAIYINPAIYQPVLLRIPYKAISL